MEDINDLIRYDFSTLKEARQRAIRGTRYLSEQGCNQILMVNRNTREVEIPSDVATIWPGVCDLMTE